MSLKIQFETVTCSRCGGTGEYPSPCWQGACLKCSRRGVVRTRKGQVAAKRVAEWMEANMSVPVTELQVGQRFIDSHGAKRTVQAVGEPRVCGYYQHPDGSRTDIVNVKVHTPKVVIGFSAGATVLRTMTEQDIRDCYKTVARLSGATLVEA